MPEKPNFITLAEEIINEDLEILREFFKEEFMPLVKYREQMEKEAGRKAIDEMYKLEES